MGGLSVISPQTGPKGSPQARPERVLLPFWTWFPTFLSEELRPYPGRYLLAWRYVLAATLTMLVIVTCRLPGAAVGGFYSLLLPRNSFSMTAKGALGLLSAFIAAMTFVLIGTMLFVDNPLTYFLWVAGSFFVGFLAVSVMTNYAAGTAFAILIVLTVPTWDLRLPTAAIVISNLWVIGSVAVALGSTLVVEVVFAFFVSKSQLDRALEERLSMVGAYLEQSAAGTIRSETKDALQHFAIIGIAGLHSLAVSGNAGAAETARRSGEVFLVGRMVDLVAALEETPEFTSTEKPRLLTLATQVQSVQARLRGLTPQAKRAGPRAEDDKWPVLLEAERTADLLWLCVSGAKFPTALADLAQPPDPPFFVWDAWTNPEHLHFALRGALALIICYIVMNAVAWPNIGSSLFTVVITTLSSTGSSRQKQLLRLSGAVIGGVILGIGSQVFILPLLDSSIASFTVLFVAVSYAAAWFITASPRLSYFGTQMALAFYIVHLSAPLAQFDLNLAWDNLMGVLLGLTVMWVVYQGARSQPAVALMRELMASNLQLMGKLAGPWPAGKRPDPGIIRALRDQISQNFGAVNAQADGVYFEVHSSHRANLQERNKLVGLLPTWRRLFLVQVALLQYGTPVSPEGLPDAILKAQAQFRSSFRSLLEGLAKSFSLCGEPTPSNKLKDAYESLREAVEAGQGGLSEPRAQAMLALSKRVLEDAMTLLNDLREVDR